MVVYRVHLRNQIWFLMHGRSLVHLDDDFWCRWATAPSTAWSLSVTVWSPSDVMLSPFIDQHLGFAQTVEGLATSELICDPEIQAFAVSVFLRVPWFDERVYRANRSNLILDGLSSKLRTIVRSNERRKTVQDQQIYRGVDEVAWFQFAIHTNGQAFSAMLVNDV